MTDNDKPQRKMTKEEIQDEYNKLTAIFGEKTYRFLVPFFELLAMGQRLMFLNQEMHRVRTEEAECLKAKAADTK